MTLTVPVHLHVNTTILRHIPFTMDQDSLFCNRKPWEFDVDRVQAEFAKEDLAEIAGIFKQHVPNWSTLANVGADAFTNALQALMDTEEVQIMLRHKSYSITTVIDKLFTLRGNARKDITIADGVGGDGSTAAEAADNDVEVEARKKLLQAQFILEDTSIANAALYDIRIDTHVMECSPKLDGAKRAFKAIRMELEGRLELRTGGGPTNHATSTTEETALRNAARAIQDVLIRRCFRANRNTRNEVMNAIFGDDNPNETWRSQLLQAYQKAGGTDLSNNQYAKARRGGPRPPRACRRKRQGEAVA